MNKKTLTLIATLLLLTGCDDKPEVKAPGFIKPHLHHLRRTVPDCFRANGIVPDKNSDYSCSLTIKAVPATGEYKGHPLFEHEGQTVGGITFGQCRGTSVIYMPVFGERYSKEVLQHEVCHAYDNCKICTKSHDPKFSPCCPHWPYIQSLGTNTNDLVEIYCLNREIVTANTNLNVCVTTLGSDIRIMSVDDDWIIDLIQTLEPDLDL